MTRRAPVPVDAVPVERARPARRRRTPRAARRPRPAPRPRRGRPSGCCGRWRHVGDRRWSAADRHPLEHGHEGVWSSVLRRCRDVPDYRLEVDYGDGPTVADDPYRFLPTLGEIDLHLIGEGRHEQLWTVLGAHVHDYPGFAGAGARHVVRRVGTQRAGRAGRRRLQLLGRPRTHPMRSLGSSGVWELFVPGVGAGTPVQVRDPRRATASGGRRPTRWPAPPRRRRPPRRSSITSALRLGRRRTGWPRARRPTRTPGR